MDRYLVCSDIHGRDELLREVVRIEKDFKALIVAGDLQLDIYEIGDIVMMSSSPKADLHMVTGNCDAYEGSASMLPYKLNIEINGHKIFLTHGHRYRNADLTMMSYAAQEDQCDIIIYGHTHAKQDVNAFGIRFINPGALRNGSYAIMEVADDGEVTVEFKSR